MFRYNCDEIVDNLNPPCFMLDLKSVIFRENRQKMRIFFGGGDLTRKSPQNYATDWRKVKNSS